MPDNPNSGKQDASTQPSESSQQTRRLAAILFADIVGYSALMEQDEAHAAKALSKFRQQLNEKVALHQGRIVNFYGDGCLAVFESPLQGVECGKEVQIAFQQAPIVPVRIGLHSGVVVFDKDNVFGDAVNQASRVESMGSSGSVLLSESIHKHIKNQKTIQTLSLGQFELKNIQEPMEVFALANKGFAIPKREEMQLKLNSKFKATNKSRGKSWSLVAVLVSLIALTGFLLKDVFFNQAPASPEPAISSNTTLKKSIAVLPFRNMSGDEDQQYFSDGMAEEILNALTQLKDLKVSARSSSFKFRGEEVDLKEVGEKLGVSTVLEGSVRKMGNRVRIIAQLINIEDEVQIWSDRYDRELEDVFAIQDEIAQAIVGKLQLTFSHQGNRQLIKAPTQSQEAYDLYLKALHYVNLGQAQKAIDSLEQAIELDPDFALAYATLSIYYFFMSQPIGKILNPEMETKIRQLAEKAIALDSILPMAHSAMTYIYHDYDNDYYKAQKDIEKILKINPSSPGLYLHLAYNTIFQSGNVDEAIAYAKKEIELDPLNSSTYFHLGLIYVWGRKDREAKALAEELSTFFPGDFWANTIIGYINYYLSDYEKAYKAYHSNRSLLENNNNVSFYLFYVASVAKVGKEAEARSLLQDLKANPKWEASPFAFASIHLALDDKEEAYNYLEQAFEMDDFTSLRFIKFDPFWDELRGEPRFEGMVKRLELRD